MTVAAAPGSSTRPWSSTSSSSAQPRTRVALVDPAEVRLGIDVPLARFPVESQGLGAAEPGGRRAARSLAVPRIGSGEQDVAIRVSQGEVQAMTIDTSAAGFASTPSYVVTPGLADTPDVAARLGRQAAGPFVSIVEATPTPYRARGAGRPRKARPVAHARLARRRACPGLPAPPLLHPPPHDRGAPCR